MRYPKVTSARAINDHTLLIEFDNRERRLYDVAPLFVRQAFQALKDPALFHAVHVEPGGYAVAWNNDIDISEHELWKHGHRL